MKIKKILALFILLISIISINTFVLADMDAPMVNPYRATITNVNGAEVRKFEENKETEIIGYGKEVEVMYEYEEENVLYAAVTLPEDEEKFNIKDIKLEDIAITKDAYVAKSLKTENPIEFIVLAKDGVDIHKGPAEAYSKTGTTIPYGEEIIAYEEIENTTPWFFVNYNGVSGWICQLDSALVTKSEEIVMVFQDVELYDIEEEIPTEPLDIIPAGTLFKNYFISDPWSQDIIVSYEGKVGSIYDRSLSIAYETPRNFKVVKDFTHMHSKPDESSRILSTNISAGTILSAEYVHPYDVWAYVIYDGVSGYVKIEDMEHVSEEDVPKIPVLPEIDESKVIDCEGKILNYDNKNNGENSEIIENNSNKTEINNGVSDKNEVPEVYTLDVNQIVCICVITAIITSLTCIVIINLINRNKKTEIKTDSKDEQ